MAFVPGSHLRNVIYGIYKIGVRQKYNRPSETNSNRIDERFHYGSVEEYMAEKYCRSDSL